ncbi:hypothetical protein HMPREF0091_10377 [Fannyhessea vaginae DSM 15829]|uniref:Uncharacterized protein n=1 Tax=Fannyhessea vaginae DSM 15829 TaxID=525256 RepID=F1T3Y6_9ACTN|nr:hypothetical protein HMPREF0091_10377 [Fannyhessea vaginae DSM 15829]
MRRVFLSDICALCSCVMLVRYARTLCSCVMLVRYIRAVSFGVMQGITYMDGYERRTRSI